ncbi:ATP-binding cassette domain-containing protein [Streptomyces sp. NPDC008238]
MSQDTPGPAEPGTTTLAELERRVAESREEPAYGHDALIVCDRLVRIFTAQGVEVQALQGLDLLVKQGELMALVGASGSGKSTLLNILAGLDTPTAGAARVAGHDLLTMNAASRLRYQRSTVGFVWQQTARNLLPYLTALQNVVLPMRLSGLAGRRRDRHARAAELLDMMGVGHCGDRRPQQMSGGEQQRTAIAVALANHPSLVLADEPTGQLDSATAEQVFSAFRTANEQLGTTIVVVTHDQAVATAVDRTVAIRDGRTASEVVRRTSTDDQGRTTVHASEYATVDRSGRLQLPRDFTHALDIRNRVMLELEPDHIAVRPDLPDLPADNAGGAPDHQGPRPAG